MSADARLQELLVRWQERQDQGKPAAVEELCGDCPELAEPLRQRIEVARAMGALLHGEGETAPEAVSRPEPKPSPWPRVPGYEIVRELGRGGMGVVYEARQVALGRTVALKMILAAQARPEERERFRAEVEAVARLRHPNLVHVYEVGEQAGRPWYSMEFVDGSNLAEKIGGKPQSPRQAAQLVETLARAMDAVHRQGIIHRDLKPANILLPRAESPEPRAGGRTRNSGPSTLDSGLSTPKITDFGLAKRLDSAGLTASGAVLGTPSYMAPEQAAGLSKQIGPATDVYALGAILYEMLTGRPPFQAETAWDTVVQVVSEEPVPPRRLQPKVPAELEIICLKCLSKEPARRYAGALPLADDLRRFLAGLPIAARPIGPLGRAVKWARRRPAAAALLVVSVLGLLTVTVGALVYGARLRTALDDVRAHAEESRQRLVSFCVGRGARLLDEDDAFGALVWFTEALRLDEGNRDAEPVHRTRIAATLRSCPRLVQLWVHDGPVREAVFSADGRRVLTTSDDHTARIWDLATGEPVTPPLQHLAAVIDGGFSPDGRAVLTASEDGTARLWSAETGRPLLPPLNHGKPLTSAMFSPDGKRVVTTGEDGTARIWAVATGKEACPPLRHQSTVEWAAFSPDGQRVVTASDDHTARVWNAATGQAVSPVLRHQGPVYHAAFDPDGVRVATASADHTARVWSVETGEEVLPPVRRRRHVHCVAFSPNGRHFLVGSDDHTATVWDAGTGAAVSTLPHRSAVNWLACSPDSRRVASAADDNTARVWSIVAGEPAAPVLRHNGAVNAATFSPDGRYLVTGGNDGAARVWDLSGARRETGVAPVEIVPPDPRKARRWTSPDGSLVVTAERGQAAQVRAAATDKSLGQPLRHGSTVLSAAFSRDSRKVITGSDDDTARIWDAATGAALTPPLPHNGSVIFVAFDPEGRLAVTAASDRLARVWDAGTGEPVTPPLPHSGAVKAAVFGPDGVLRLTSADGAESTCDLRPDARFAADLQSLAHLLAGARVASARGLQPLDAAELLTAWRTLRSRYPELGPGGEMHDAPVDLRSRTWSRLQRKLLDAPPQDQQN